MKIEQVKPRIFHVSFDNRYDTAMTFLRYQEYYEGVEPWFRKPFKILDYMHWYAQNKGKGAFTYPTDWAGFNIPGWVLHDFFHRKLEKTYDGWNQTTSLGFLEYQLKDDWNRHDTMMNWIIQTIQKSHGIAGDDWNFYLIGTTSTSKRLDTTLNHEIAHGLYYTNPLYKAEMDAIITEMSPVAKAEWFKNLTTMGYHPSVVDDEIQAYCSTDTKYLTETVAVATPFQEVFKKYNG